MNSIFDEEELAVARRTRYVMPLLAPRSADNLGFAGFPELPRATYAIDDKRKRTRAEALARLYSIRPQTQDLPYGIQRALRRPLVIYEASLWLAAGLVIADPLDRLDGVI